MLWYEQNFAICIYRMKLLTFLSLTVFISSFVRLTWNKSSHSVFNKRELQSLFPSEDTEQQVGLCAYIKVQHKSAEPRYGTYLTFVT